MSEQFRPSLESHPMMDAAYYLRRLRESYKDMGKEVPEKVLILLVLKMAGDGFEMKKFIQGRKLT